MYNMFKFVISLILILHHSLKIVINNKNNVNI